MAHTDACKIQCTEFTKKCVDAGMSLNQACKQTELESDGIPANIIKRWWYEVTNKIDKQFKNEPLKSNNQIKTEVYYDPQEGSVTHPQNAVAKEKTPDAHFSKTVMNGLRLKTIWKEKVI